MESIIKELPIPKEATKMLEEVPAIQELIEPEPQGLGGLEIAVIVVIAAGALGLLAKKFCKCKK